MGSGHMGDSLQRPTSRSLSLDPKTQYWKDPGTKRANNKLNPKPQALVKKEL